MNKAEELVSKLLLSRDLAHLAHWRTKSYAKHKALNEFYDQLLDLTDGFVEQYQGYYSRRMDIKISSASLPEDIAKHIDYDMEWIEKNRDYICDSTETALQNTLDEIVRLHQTTIYLLTLE